MDTAGDDLGGPMHAIDVAHPSKADASPLTEFEGRRYGSGVSLIVVSSDQPGAGPDLHRHPYPETFVIRAGVANFRVGDERVVGVGGQIIVVPANTPHSFTVTGPDRLEMIDIHASDHFVTDWLEGPRAPTR